MPVTRQYQRSIPACAGEPRLAPPLALCKTVYPRVCGGTGADTRFFVLGSGLSPRVRGNPKMVRQAMQEYRSIPACAGEPSLRVRAASTPWVYPRVCGGTEQDRVIATSIQGLSPRVRGNPGPASGMVSLDRSIPACAGEPVISGS